jgi:hypothetical protein
VYMPRVHELALEFGVTSREVLAELRDMGVLVKLRRAPFSHEWPSGCATPMPGQGGGSPPTVALNRGRSSPNPSVHRTI